MSALLTGLAVFGCVFGGALLGLGLRSVVPSHHRSADSKDVVRLGMGLLVYVQVTLDRTTTTIFDRFRQGVLAIPEVLECHMVAGGFDYLLKLRVPDMAAYRAVLGDRLGKLPGLLQTHSYFVMEEVKDAPAIPIAEG